MTTPTTQREADERAAFEAWARPNSFYLLEMPEKNKRGPASVYYNERTQQAWEGFKAGRASLTPTAPAPSKPVAHDELQSAYHADYHYLLGLRAGWNLSQQRDVEGFNAALVSRQISLDTTKADMLATPTAPQAGIGQWVRCTPDLINAGVSCAHTPRRAGDGSYSHDHWISHAAPQAAEEKLRDFAAKLAADQKPMDPEIAAVLANANLFDLCDDGAPQAASHQAGEWGKCQLYRGAPQAATTASARCVICCADEPRTGTCGSDDPRALCNQATTASAPKNCGTVCKASQQDGVLCADGECDIESGARTATTASDHNSQDLACSCPSGDGSLNWPCPAHPPEATTASASNIELELAKLAAEHYGRDDGDIPALVEWERYRVKQSKVVGMSGLHAIPSFIAGFHAGRAALARAPLPDQAEKPAIEFSPNADDESCARRVKNFSVRAEPSREPDFVGEKSILVTYNGRQEYTTALAPHEARRFYDLLAVEYGFAAPAQAVDVARDAGKLTQIAKAILSEANRGTSGRLILDRRTEELLREACEAIWSRTNTTGGSDK